MVFTSCGALSPVKLVRSPNPDIAGEFEKACSVRRLQVAVARHPSNLLSEAEVDAGVDGAVSGARADDERHIPTRLHTVGEKRLEEMGPPVGE